MSRFDSPFFLFAVMLVAQWLAAYTGDTFRKRVRRLKKEERGDFDVVRTASLTLLGLIIGFSFAMAVSRYDQRKNLEEAEANAIGTEYNRADLLPADDALRVRQLLTQYTEKRISYYLARDEHSVEQINADAQKLQAELWSAVVRVAATQPTPVVALALSGMNDVLNSQGYTQAAWLNRIPLEAWALAGLIAISCNLLLGYGEHRTSTLLLVLPVIVSIAIFLIADIDNPRGGVIWIHPTNLISQYQTMKQH